MMEKESAMEERGPGCRWGERQAVDRTVCAALRCVVDGVVRGVNDDVGFGSD